MASEVGTGTFWQAIVDQVTGPPLPPVLDELQPVGRLARRPRFDSARRHRDPGAAPVVTGVARAAAVVATRAAGVALGGVREEGW